MKRAKRIERIYIGIPEGTKFTERYIFSILARKPHYMKEQDILQTIEVITKRGHIIESGKCGIEPQTVQMYKAEKSLYYEK